jgi:hypothetical protein
MEGLARGDEIDGSIAESGGFRPPVHAVEAAGAAEVGLGHRRHLAIGLHAVHDVPVLHQEPRQDPGAGPDVGHDVRRLKPEVGAQRLEDGRRIAGTPAHVVLDPVAEAGGGIGHEEKHNASE